MATFPAHQLERNLIDRDLDTYRRLSFNDSEYQPEDFQFFNPVARVEAEDLEHVFHLTNAWNDLDRVRRYMPMHSLSVGDIVESHNHDQLGHRYFMVAGFGFNEIEVA